jgi:hypothetical protein
MSVKYELEVREVEKPVKVPDEVKDRLKGLSPKLVSKMKKEVVDCPVLGREVPFLQCYFCPNFVRRVKGVVHCKGLPLQHARRAG